MSFHISDHAQAELHRRNIPRFLLDTLLASPEQKVPEHGTVVWYQSLVIINRKQYVLRAMVEEGKQPPVVVTAYRSSKIAKYWKQTP